MISNLSSNLICSLGMSTQFVGMQVPNKKTVVIGSYEDFMYEVASIVTPIQPLRTEICLCFELADMWISNLI